MRKSLVAMLALGLLAWVVGQLTAQPLNDATQATVLQDGSITVFMVPNVVTQVGAGIDFVHAQPMKLPRVPAHMQASAREDLIRALTSRSVLIESGAAPAGQGNGRMNPIHLGVPHARAADADEVTPQEFGANNHPFSTAQADLTPVATNTSFPYRAAGKLFFNIGTDTFVCSASLIQRGVVVTAAHCVANF